MAKKEVATKRKGGQEVTNWKEELAREAQQESSRVQADVGNKIKLDKKLKFIHGGADLGNEINVIVVGHIKVHAYYDTPYDEDNITAPACFAHSTTGENMAPLDESPAKQSEICEDCWAFKFKSDDRQKGKACGENHLLAVIFTDDVADSDDPEITLLKVPVTSGATFRRYIKTLNSNDMPSWAVMTTVKFDENADWQKLLFDLDGEVPEKYLSVCRSKFKASMEMLMVKPDFSTYKGGSGSKKAKTKKSDAKAAKVPTKSAKPAAKAGRSRLS